MTKDIIFAGDYTLDEWVEVGCIDEDGKHISEYIDERKLPSYEYAKVDRYSPYTLIETEEDREKVLEEYGEDAEFIEGCYIVTADYMIGFYETGRGLEEL